jgi:hypothetical protein
MNTVSVIAKIETFVVSRGGRVNDWYVGITKNPGRRLFGDHKVPINEDTWIYSEAPDSETARAVESHFLAQDFDGGPGGGDTESKFVYAYRKTALTLP